VLIKPVKISDDELRRAVRVLKNVEPETLKALRADMATTLKPYADRAALQMPTKPALSGFARDPGWGAAKGIVQTAPSRTRKSGYKIVNIAVQSTRNTKTKGLLLAEFGGTKSKGFTRLGEAMIRNLNAVKQIKRGAGRFTYDYIRAERRAIVKLATDVLNGYMKKASRYL
jgi:hypothetical protein